MSKRRINTRSSMERIASGLGQDLNSDSLFSFSSILSAKYRRGGRIAPSQTSIKSATNRTVSSNVTDTEHSSQSYRPISNWTNQSAKTHYSKNEQRIPITEYLQKTHSDKEDRNKDRSECRRLKPFLYLLCLGILIIVIAIVLFATLHTLLPKAKTTTTTVTTITTTTVTTSTTSTTSTSTSSSSSTSTTSVTTTTITTTTDTTTTETTSTTETTTTTSCYSGDDYVNLIAGGTRRISNLKTGDRIWTLSHDGKQLIEDEIMCIPHAGPHSLTYFYTFTTSEGHTVSLTDAHYIVVVNKHDSQIEILRASSVTFDHKLMMFNRNISIEKIDYSARIGFYSPITLSGYLLVNNLSTSVYVECFTATHDFLHQITGPARIYYRLTRWLFGNEYNPFGTRIDEEIHPISRFVMNNHQTIRFIFNIFPYIILLLSINLTKRFLL